MGIYLFCDRVAFNYFCSERQEATRSGRDINPQTASDVAPAIEGHAENVLKQCPSNPTGSNWEHSAKTYFTQPLLLLTQSVKLLVDRLIILVYEICWQQNDWLQYQCINNMIC